MNSPERTRFLRYGQNSDEHSSDKEVCSTSISPAGNWLPGTVRWPVISGKVANFGLSRATSTAQVTMREALAFSIKSDFWGKEWNGSGIGVNQE